MDQLDVAASLLGQHKDRVIISGMPDQRIRHARGLRQGDPLSPLLFVLVMEALNAMFRAADRGGLLTCLDDKAKVRSFFYADDVVIFLSPKQQDLVLARGILEIFGQATGLRINDNKCLISPVHCDLENTSTLLQFGRV